MEQNPSQKIRNDFKPYLEKDGSPSCAQKTREFPLIFDRVCAGYGMPKPARQFVHRMYSLLKPGQRYAVSDDFLAGEWLVSPNYICKIRKKYKEWTEQRAEIGTRNFKVVSIVENDYNWTTKKQDPTQYIFSSDFAAMLGVLCDQVHAHRLYREDYLKAIKAVVAESNKILGEYGTFTLRKQKRERSADNIVGTYLLSDLRRKRKIIYTLKSWGFSAEYAGELIDRHTAENTALAVAESVIVSDPTIKIPAKDARGNDHKLLPMLQSNLSLDDLFVRALRYVESKEQTPETVLPLKLINPNFHAEASTYDRGFTGQLITNAAGEETSRLPSLHNVLDVGEAPRPLPQSGNKNSVGKSELKFLEKFGVREKVE